MTGGPIESSFHSALAAIAEETNETLRSLLDSTASSNWPKPRRTLHEAMRYAVLGSGKRFRAFLSVAASDIFDIPRKRSLRLAASIECLHAYSLVHDDLPAMDADEVRRGLPTVHCAYDEAVAILVGDALQAFAFEILAESATHPDARIRASLVLGLAQAAGEIGMVGGQIMDLHALPEEAYVRDMQRRKTGALICFSCRAAGILGDAEDDVLASLEAFGAALGTAFQIRDDLLDVEGSEGEVGKRVGKDSGAGKQTFVGLLGANGARAAANELCAVAQSRIARFGERALWLREAAAFVMERKH